MAKVFDVEWAIKQGASEAEIADFMVKNKLNPLQTLPKVEAKKKRSGLANLLPLLGSIGGGVLGGIGGSIIPVAGTLAGGVGGSALGGGIGELLAQKLSGEDTNVGAIGKEALISGISGGVGGTALKLLGKGAKPVLSGIGNDLTQSTLRAGIGSATTNTPDDLLKLAAFKSKYKIFGSPVASANKANASKDTIKSELLGLLKKSPELPRTELRQQLEQKMLGSVQGSDNPAAMKRAVTHYLSIFDKAKPGNKGLLELRDELWSQTQKKSALPSARSAAVQELYDGLNQVLGGTSKKVASLLEDQALAHEATKVFSTTAGKGLQLPIIGNIPMASRPAGALKDLMARSFSAMGNTAPRGVMGSIGTTGAQQLTGRGILGGAGISGGQPEMDQGMGQEADIQSLLSQASGTQADTGLPSNNTAMGGEQDMGEKLKMAALLDLMAGGKNVTKLLALAKAYEKPKMGEAQAAQISQIQAATGLVDELENAFLTAEGAGQTGFLTGPASGIAGKVTGGMTGKEAYLYDSAKQGFTALIARATGERGVLTDADAARALALLPKLNDQPDVAVDKLNRIRRIFAEAEQRLSIPRGTTDSTSSSDDMMSLLGEE